MPRLFPKYKEEAKKKIIQAAMTVAIRKGYQRMTIEDVAKEIGVTKGALYVYFRNKEDLFNEVLIGMSKIIRTAMVYSHTDGDLDTVLNHMADQLFGMMTPNAPVYAEFISISSRDPSVHRMLGDTYWRNIRVMEDELQNLQERKLLPGDLDLYYAARKIAALSTGMGVGNFLGTDKEETKKLWIAGAKKLLDIE